MVVEQVRAFNEVSMLSSAKHFPGRGSVSGDSHQGSIETDRTLEEMDTSELVPFRAAIEAGVPMIMVGHIACPAITGDDTPASLSHTIVTDVLRGHLGFDGLVITDSLEMGAVEGMAAKDQGVEAIKAGCDLVLLPQDYEAAYNGVLDAVKSGDITEEQIDEHLSRILRVKLAWMGDLPRWNS
jgi:beta-N-acetylhexosaminidase